MKKFFVDLWEMVYKPSFDWLKIHWKGYLVLITVIELLVFGVEIIRRKIEKKEWEELRKEIHELGVDETE